jgi:nitroreductase
VSASIEPVRALLRTRQFRHFTTEPVSDDDLLALATVGRWSGSSTNSQPWRFLLVRDVALIRSVAELGLPQTRSLRTAMAAIAITLPDDDARAVSLAYDDGRVAERLLVGAQMLGLGSGIAWVMPHVRQQMGELLGVGEGRFVRTIMALGHLSEEDRAPKSAPGQARLPLDEIASWT